jgi:hypothetical protein
VVARILKQMQLQELALYKLYIFKQVAPVLIHGLTKHQTLHQRLLLMVVWLKQELLMAQTFLLEDKHQLVLAMLNTQVAMAELTTGHFMAVAVELRGQMVMGLMRGRFPIVVAAEQMVAALVVELQAAMVAEVLAAVQLVTVQMVAVAQVVRQGFLLRRAAVAQS